MATLRPFQGWRPTREIAPKLASLPYDVIDSQEARQIAAGNPHSFLHVTKPEIDLDPGIDLYDQKVYDKARANFLMFQEKGYLVQDATPHLYVYKQVMEGRTQIGLMGCCAATEYWDDTIKKHEFTRKAKEEDRLKHVDVTNCNAGPVFLTYPARAEIDVLTNEAVKGQPVIDFTSDDGISHTLWAVNDAAWIKKVTQAFAAVPHLYVADGHHRSAAASRIAKVRQAANPHHTGNEEYNYFLAVLFPHNHLYIMDYNRSVKDLHGLTPETFLARIKEKFEVVATTDKKPVAAKSFGMYFQKCWYRLTAKTGSFPAQDPVASLDVSILQNNLLTPILGIGDPRTDDRIDFIGGIRGVGELERIVDNGSHVVSFCLFPTSIEQLMAIADSGQVMPPKSTWFEPKLRSGMVVHTL